MPGDQRGDDAFSACFDTGPLDADMDIVGAPQLKLTLSADTPQGQISVRLNHVLPDGSSTRVTYGVLNLSHRNSHAEPEPLTVGAPVEVTVTLDHIAYRLPAGNKLRVAISSAYWPLIWPSPETATLTLSKGEIALPVRPTAKGDECAFPAPEAETPWQTHALRASSNSRRIETDLKTGIVSLIIEDDFGKVEDADHGLISGTIARETWSIHPDDPLSARGTCHWTNEGGRSDLNLRTETFSEMWSDTNSFFLKARLEAYENDVLIYERDVYEEVPRDNL